MYFGLENCVSGGHSQADGAGTAQRSGVLMGKVKYSWQDADYVWSWFGKRAGQARRVYRRYVSEGIKQGRRPEFSFGFSAENNGNPNILGVALIYKNLRDRAMAITSEKSPGIA